MGNVEGIEMIENKTHDKILDSASVGDQKSFSSTESAVSSGKKSAYGSKVSYVARLFDDELDDIDMADETSISSDNEMLYLPRFCLSSLIPKSGLSLAFAGLIAAFRLYFRELEIKNVSGRQIDSIEDEIKHYVSPFILSPFGRNNRFIRFVSGCNTKELDSFLLDRETLSYVLCREAASARLAMIDADRPLFESQLYGQAQKLDEGQGRSPVLASPDHFARQTQTPVILVIDASEMRGQIVPLLKGAMAYARPANISAVILNKMDPAYYSDLKTHIENECNIPVLGYIPFREIFVDLEANYYETPLDMNIFSNRVQELAETIMDCVDMDNLFAIAERASTLRAYISKSLFQVQKGLGSKSLELNIAYTYDEAFDDCSRENLDMLRDLGINLIPVSPLHDDILQNNIDGLYLSSSKLLKYRKQLSDGRKFNKSLQYSAMRGLPIFAENEAYLYTSQGFTLSDENIFWPMCSITQHRHLINREIDTNAYEYISMTNAVNNSVAGIHWTLKGVARSYLLDADCGNAMKVKLERNRQSRHMAFSSANVFAIPGKVYFMSEPRTLLRFVSSCLQYKEDCMNRQFEDTEIFPAINER